MKRIKRKISPFLVVGEDSYIGVGGIRLFDYLYGSEEEDFYFYLRDIKLTINK